MNKRNFYVEKMAFLFLLLIPVFSCNNKERETSEIISIDLLSPPGSSITNLSDIAEDIEFIPLVTSDSSLVGRIREVKVQDDIIYVNVVSELLCFNKEGKYLSKLSREGRGPGEYSSILDFDVTDNGDMLAITSSRDINIYEKREKEFIYCNTLEQNNTVSRINFIPGNDNILVSFNCFGEVPLQNIIISIEGDTLASRLNYYKFQNEKGVVIVSMHQDINYRYDNSVCFREWKCDTIFKVNSDYRFVPHIILNSDGNQPTAESFTEYVSQDVQAILNGSPTKGRVIVQSILEVSDYVIYRYHYLENDYFEIYDKVKGEKYSVDAELLLTDDIAGSMNFEPKISDGTKLYSWVEAINLKEYAEGAGFEDLAVIKPEYKRALEQLAGSLEETDNPVLIAVSLKE